MKKTTVGLGIICKDEVEDVYRILKNYGKYFDKICVTVTNKKEWEAIKKFDKLKDKVYVNYFEWCNDFSKARNFNYSHLGTDWIFYMDCDDDIDHPEKIREIAEKANLGNIDLVWMYYYYDLKEGVEHWKERLMRNDGTFEWKGVVHENLIAKENRKFEISSTDEVALIHRPTEERQDESASRNLQLLLQEYKKDGDKTDPRILSYIAMTLYGMGGYKDCIPFFNKHIEKSGWKEDVYNSWVVMARAYQHLEDYKSAIGCLYEAMDIRSDFPDAYLALAEVKFYEKDWKGVEQWTLVGLQKKKPKFGIPSVRTSNYTFRPLVFLSHAYLNDGEIDKAFNTITSAKTIAPKNESVLKQYDFIEKVYTEKKYLQNMVWMKTYLEENDKETAFNLPSIIPANLASDDRFIKLRNALSKPHKWNEKSIVIYCGEAWEDWADPSVITGIGGSEEAVVYASRELVKQGYEVTVFNSCGNLEGEYNGVVYKNWYNFNPVDVFNTLICWRGSLFRHYNLKAKKKIVWLHDVPAQNEFNEKELKEIDHIIVLSQYHKSLLPTVPEDKLYVSTNGIVPEQFKPDALKQDFRMCYTSSPDRGLEHLLDRWEDIKEGCPEAELHIYYGWGTFDKRFKENKEMQAWKAEMVEKMKQHGIKWYGRIGHKKLAKEMARCRIFAYPCNFEEINCISVLKAQASNCLALTTNYGALNETNEYGIKIKGNTNDKKVMDKWVENIIYELNHPTDQKCADKILKKYSWENVTQNWSKDIL